MLNELRKRHSVVVISSVHPAFFPDLPVRCQSWDVGLVQIDSIRADLSASLELNLQLIDSAPERLRLETKWLAEAGVRLVVCDSPALPLVAARQAALPGLLLGSFGWDFIYSAYVGENDRWGSVSRWYAEAYSQATAMLQYPLSIPVTAIERRVTVPLVSSPGQDRRSQLGISSRRPWVLLWFHESTWPTEVIASLPFEFLTVRALPDQPTNVHHVRIAFEDAVASCDVLMSKVGFGVVSDCVTQQKPMVYVPRDDFPESPHLETWIRQHLAWSRLEASDFYAGTWELALQQALTLPIPPRRLEVDGAARVAELVLEYLC